MEIVTNNVETKQMGRKLASSWDLSASAKTAARVCAVAKKKGREGHRYLLYPCYEYDQC